MTKGYGTMKAAARPADRAERLRLSALRSAALARGDVAEFQRLNRAIADIKTGIADVDGTEAK